MNIQNYINQYQDYLVKFNDDGMQINKYNVLGLTLVKYKNYTEFNDFNKFLMNFENCGNVL